MVHPYIYYAVCFFIVFCGSAGLGFMLGCIIRNRLTNRNLWIGGLGVTACLGMLMLLPFL